ncbi:valine--tRNA ligase [Candidatus Nomurabacteria bacterium RIFOXYC2_FULL_36_8]|nr:MAG: Valine-tRNA ligase [Candidatus Nomurabacteria bacterium GW2011_GWE2_36_115]KKP94288.1 MAG: Valine-tRNA ligase [Candidatus Nomurabacteria bacterium GW2011_GWF2_36_126]KKP96585.1 MAG: Valine-tRNA ligase [Candidatus Nomurabacteria bacterium GW2011_GWD2_36_14]KKP99811.1 MAG: Valine-tRNA ligase [Candidatus Nomurabacteria bacterium GW2011_GWF2_36_19]KKQ05243.1 MAG: Valine-tRNA ligase [Candidatus Nomurabacteria bacterium GW2011_GWF1_36_47]KKQ09284.1 MAG: Valine-tRNA ligase [Candidatus Nomurab
MQEPNIDPKLLKPYDPKETEDRIYKIWEESGFFNPDVCIEKGVTDKDATTFSMVLPPPNVTGTLHLGHAATLTIEDIMTRFARMQGKRTLWLPGTDHAAIATQSKVEKILEKEEGKRKTDLGREEFLKRVNKFAQESHDTIINQSKKMGASLDWSREAFTLDEKRNLAVRTAFKKMYGDGLIYRGHRIVNWDPKGQTVISDDEIVYEERKAKFYTFKYSKDFPISISTTRPETKVGDTAVAVNPKDERYTQYIGKTFTIEDFCGVKLEIKVVADDAVEKEFGTGALGVTPAHSQIDAEIAMRHNLPTKQVINEFAKMTVGDERILNKKTTEARLVIAEWLKSEGLLEKEEEVTQNISTAERTGGIIEPLPKLQWFINVNKPIADRNNKTLKELMLEAVRGGEINIIPDRFEKVYYNWIENLRDWCISRQIWYGHRIPVWYKSEEIYCGVEAPKEDGWIQDEDTLDTWFSSGLWTFSTLGWPDLNATDFKTYHPTNMLETGYDILFFWIARMILMSTYLIGEVPFKTVYLHGIVRDSQGRKMSKSLGNAMDPLDLTQKYGADAVRMSLIIGTGPGNDSKMSEDKIRAYKNYANKLWNITRFVLSSTENIKLDSSFNDYSDKDKELIKERHDLIVEITKEMDEYKFYIVGEKIYHYTWSRFADVILEESKEIFKNGTNEEKESRAQFLLDTLTKILKILHPFMPFVTEEIWSIMPIDNKKLLMVERWPETERS